MERSLFYEFSEEMFVVGETEPNYVHRLVC
jgi:hypothetical protein